MKLEKHCKQKQPGKGKNPKAESLWTLTRLPRPSQGYIIPPGAAGRDTSDLRTTGGVRHTFKLSCEALKVGQISIHWPMEMTSWWDRGRVRHSASQILLACSWGEAPPVPNVQGGRAPRGVQGRRWGTSPHGEYLLEGSAGNSRRDRTPSTRGLLSCGHEARKDT